MPIYRIEVIERRPKRATYEFEAADASTALNLMLASRDKAMTEVTKVELVEQDNPTEEAAQEHAAVQERMSRGKKPTREDGPEKMAEGLSHRELMRLVNVVQQYLWWDSDRDAWYRHRCFEEGHPAEVLYKIAGLFEEAGLRPVTTPIVDHEPKG